MTDRPDRVPHLTPDDWVAQQASGLGEAVLLADVENRFRGWRTVQYEITPDFTWGALAHLEAGGFRTPGDAPVVFGLARAGVPAGSEEAEQIYARAHTVAQNLGKEWDAVEPTHRDLYAQALASSQTRAESNTAAYGRGELPYSGGVSYAPNQAPQTVEVPDDGFSLWSAIKGVSRWGVLAFDAIPEGIDALNRAISHVKAGNLSPIEAIGGMIGADREAGQLVGIPLFQYAAAGLRGERLNMGQGFFAEGDIAPDIADAMAAYDAETEGMVNPVTGEVDPTPARELFDRLLERNQGKVYVTGPDGTDYLAEDFEEWQFLRRNAGRAGLLGTLQYSSPDQAALGQAFGTFNESVFDEGLITKTTFDPLTGGDNRGFVPSFGRTVTSLFLEPRSDPFDVVSAPLDLGKQLVDLNLVGVAGRGFQVLNKGRRFIGQAGEAGDLIRGTDTARKVFGGSDADALDGVIRDLTSQTLNRDLASNALARGGDEALMGARTFTASALKHAPGVLNSRRQAEITKLIRDGVAEEKAINMVGSGLTGPRIQDLVRRAGRGDAPARQWLTDVMVESPTPAKFDEVSQAVDNMVEVTRRGDVDLVGGRYGRAVVDDEVAAAARVEVDSLADLLEGRRASFIGDKAKVVADPERGFMLTFDADLGRAQGTLNRLYDTIDGTADATQAAGKKGALVENLFNERWITKRWAEKALGDGDEASAEISNLVRVLRRNESATDLVNHTDEFARILPEGKIRDLLTGDSAMADMVDSFVNAKTMREVDAILGPSKEFAGRTIDPRLKKLLRDASTKESVVEAIISAGETSRLIPQRIGLLGNYARAGNLLTSAGVAVGGVGGAIDAASQEDAGVVDIIGGAISGAIAMGLLGSGVAGGGAVLGGGTTRTIDSVADAMDVMLAGTRATTMDFLRAHGVEAGRAQAGLSVPSLLSYGFGHSSWGRRMARSYRSTVNINDPYDMYYTLTDLARGFGVTTDDVVTVVSRGTGPAKEWDRIIRSGFDNAEDYQRAVDEALGNGFTISRTLQLDDAFARIADLQTNNTGAAWVALRELFDGLDNILVSRGLDPETSKVLTRFATEGADEFLGNVNAIGQSANLAQGMVVNGRYSSLENAPLMMSEMWAGKVTLPPPELVHRAVARMDTLGKLAQNVTGAGVWGWNGSIKRELSKAFKAGADFDPHKVFDPALERNVLTTTARAVTGTLWAPMVLLTRPLSFISRVLGEDQARMTAAGLDSFFAHPWNYITAVLSDSGLRGIKPRGVAARSLIPDDIFDEVGQLVDDGLDRLNHLAVSERIQRGLGIYNREEAAGRKIFGQTHWSTIRKGNPAYKRSMAFEFRQVLTDPLARKMAQSTADDVVDDTLRWLTETAEGRKIAADWARQFSDPKQAELYLANDEMMRAFLEDEHARLHLKTGGDWIFVFDEGGTKVGFTSKGEQLDAVASGIKLDDYDAGYHIIRGGDPEMLQVVAEGRLPDSWLSKGLVEGEELPSGVISGQLDERKLEAIHDYVAAKHDSFEQALGRQGADLSAHRFPEVVKGTRTNVDIAKDKVSFIRRWDDALDRFYDRVLGQPTNWFSRQPTLGQYYWERVGLMLPSMSDEVATKFRSLAEAEGMTGRVNKIADAMGRTDVARRVIDDFDMMDLNAKAYAVERTKDILFDLTRQRNFIDGMRIVAPFAGPMVEALEAWGRVAKGNPVYIWRRGGQLLNHLWDTDPLALQKETGFGTFWVNDDGEEMFTFPYSGPVMSWMHNNISQGIPAGPLTARARGFNVVFGPDDLSDPGQPQFMGVPIAGLNPGQGPGFTLPVAPLLRDREGVLGEINEFLFPFGAPRNVLETFMPYHLRKALEGATGSGSRRDQVRTAAEQFSALVASGEVGNGPQFTYDTSTPGGVNKAWEEARSRGRWGSLVEGVIRGSVPTLVTPEVYVEIETMKENGVNTDALMNLSALQEEARTLYSDDGAKTIDFPDGTQLSTEGDWEAITTYLNQTYGLDLFSAELLTMSPATTVHPRQFTAAGRSWMNQRGESLIPIAPNTIHLLMPDYGLHEDDEFDPQAREEAIKRGDQTYADIDQYDAEIQSRLLSIRHRQIDLQATEAFGPDDLLEGPEQAEKDTWVNYQKQAANGIYERALIPVSQDTQALNELLTWDRRDWESAGLEPAEMATVNAVRWYLAMEAQIATFPAAAGLTDITNKGASDAQREAGIAAREDLNGVVQAQLDYSAQNGHDLGNFPYLWARYLKPRLEVDDEEADPLMALAELESPWGVALETLRNENE